MTRVPGRPRRGAGTESRALVSRATFPVRRCGRYREVSSCRRRATVSRVASSLPISIVAY